MIWVWVVAAVTISWLLCRKNINWQHYIWLLLPIEMYGISIAGATIKPYMIFGVVIILSNIIKGRSIQLPKTIIIIVMLLFLSDIVTGWIMASVMQHLMFVLVLVIAYNYLYSQDNNVDFDSISTVTIATTIGYGLIFLIAYLSVQYGVNLPDVYTTDRYSTGMVVQSILTGVENTETIRLRGFCIDPNAVIIALIPGAGFGLANIFYRKKQIVKSILAVVLFFLTVSFSGSRMAVICSLFMLVVMFIIGYRQSENKSIWLKTGIVGLLTIAVLIVLNRGKIFADIAYELEVFFGARASLTDNAGRFTIWKNNLDYLIENNRLLIGVGQNQIGKITVQGKDCHNTWLEWVCGTGLIIGLFMSFYFLLAPKSFSKKVKKNHLLYNQGFLPTVLAYIITLICITTVDNITNAVLLIIAVMFRYGIPMKKENNLA